MPKSGEVEYAIAIDTAVLRLIAHRSGHGPEKVCYHAICNVEQLKAYDELVDCDDVPGVKVLDDVDAEKLATFGDESARLILETMKSRCADENNPAYFASHKVVVFVGKNDMKAVVVDKNYMCV